MPRYPELKSQVRPGDLILTEHNIIKGKRMVRVTDGLGIECEGIKFNWDHWFEVNHPVK